MSAKIFKYALSPGRQIINTRLGARILHISGRESGALMWLLVPDVAEPIMQDRKIFLVRTHEEFELQPNHVYHGTARASGTDFHVFEEVV
jgi:hypothetical protein